MKSIKLYGFFLTVLTALAPATHAQFGSGIVFDPTQSAHALQQIEQGSQIYTTAVATVLPALLITLFVCIYGLIKIPELTSAILSGRAGTWVNVMGD